VFPVTKGCAYRHPPRLFRQLGLSRLADKIPPDKQGFSEGGNQFKSQFPIRLIGTWVGACGVSRVMREFLTHWRVNPVRG
jgi:hypothetical protein